MTSQLILAFFAGALFTALLVVLWFLVFARSDTKKSTTTKLLSPEKDGVTKFSDEEVAAIRQRYDEALNLKDPDWVKGVELIDDNTAAITIKTLDGGTCRTTVMRKPLFGDPEDFNRRVREKIERERHVVEENVLQEVCDKVNKELNLPCKRNKGPARKVEKGPMYDGPLGEIKEEE